MCEQVSLTERVPDFVGWTVGYSLISRCALSASRSGIALVVSICASIAAAIASLFVMGQYSPRADLTANQNMIDFGRLTQGEVKTAIFTLTNHSHGHILLNEVSAGCSCRSAVLSRKLLQPNESATLTVVWKVGARRGSVDDLLWVEYALNTEGTPRIQRRLEMSIRATVTPEIEYFPTKLEFEADKVSSATVQFASGTISDFVIKHIACTSNSFSAAYDLKRRELVVTYTPSGQLDYADGIKAVVKTNGVHEPTLYISVHVRNDK